MKLPKNVGIRPEANGHVSPVSVGKAVSPLRSATGFERGMALLECVVYIALLGLVMSMAYAGFYSVLEHTTRLQRSAADINRVLAAGEQWREDVRKSAGLPRQVESGGDMVWQILRGNEPVVYLFKGDTVYRLDNKGQKPFLMQVKSSRMLVDKRAVNSCRWEVELDGWKKPSKMKPLFTFQAVPGK